MLKVFFFMVFVSEVFTLKCHICKNWIDDLCFEIENSNNLYLKTCKKDENECAVLQEKKPDPNIIRMCISPSWKCDEALYKCGQCTSDGCNIDKEVKVKQKIANIIPPSDELGYLIKANTFGILIVTLLISLVCLWCIIGLCSRKKKEEEESEDDCNEYYENETNIDLE